MRVRNTRVIVDGDMPYVTYKTSTRYILPDGQKRYKSGRACSCGTVLSMYNGNRKCYSCMRRYRRDYLNENIPHGSTAR